EARKAIKRCRALIHLVDSERASKPLRKIEKRLRAAARSLAGARNAQAMLETLARLEEHYGERWSVNLLQGLRAAFYGRKQRAEALLGPAAEQSLDALENTRAALEGLPVRLDAEGLRAGLKATYARSRVAWGTAHQSGDAEAFHRWRRELQRHWRQMELLVAAWPEEMEVRIRRAASLSQCLGDDHDLYLLLGFIGARGAEFAGWEELERFVDGCIARQAALRLKASGHGRLLFAESPKAFAGRIMAYWDSASARFGQGAPASIWDDPPDQVVPFPGARSKAGQPGERDEVTAF
ncbi:MAG: CHAD domain-containing protein, partial [Alphaproteobacteria bacterium]